MPFFRDPRNREPSHIADVEVAVFPEVDGAGDDGQEDRQPDRNGDEVSSPAAEYNLAHLAPCGIDHPYQDGDDGDDLRDSLVFAEAFGGQDTVPGGGQQTQSGDGEFSGNNDRAHPGGNAPQFDKNDEGTAGEYLISQRIQQDAKVGDQLVPAGDVTVKEVGQSRRGEQDKRQRLGKREGNTHNDNERPS